MKTFKQYNESVRDKMTPKPKDVVKRELEELPLKILFTKIFNKGIPRDVNFNLFSKAELLDKFDKLDTREQIKTIGSLTRLGFTDMNSCFDYLQSRLGYSLWTRLKLKTKPKHMFDFMHSIDGLKKHELVKIFTILVDVADEVMNESIKDKMTPKTPEDIKKSLEPLMVRVAQELTFMSNISGMEDFEEAYPFVVSKISTIQDLVLDDNYTDPKEIALSLASIFLDPNS